MTSSLWDGLESQLGLAGLAARAQAAFAASAEPEAAAERARGVLATAGREIPAALSATWRAQPGRILRVLSTLCGSAPFFVPILERHPDWLVQLSKDDLARPRDPDEIGADLAGGDDAASALRLVKYRELARITVRELSRELVPESAERVTLQELSDLADAILAQAVEVARTRAGEGSWTHESGTTVRPGFCVLALGKLGGEELNYSSDVDLIYVYESTSGVLEGGPRDQSVPEYMNRLATELGRIVTSATADGFLYRIDLDLRPEGAQGPLVVSSEALAEYYDTRAATWERAAFTKARPVAGDIDLGWRIVRAAAPVIFRRSMDFASVAAIRDLKEGVEKAKGRKGSAFNLKIGAGGIRDIECIAQSMQLLHGGRIPQVRGRSTPEALDSLRAVGLLEEETANHLLGAYLFLRRVENRVQMIGERQVYTLPTDDAARRRLARSLGFLGDDPWSAFEARRKQHCSRVRAAFEELLPEAPGERVRDLFRRFAGLRHQSLHAARLLDQLAEGFALAIEAGPDPERAMNNLTRFVEGLGSSKFYYELLLDRPELVGRLASLFAASEYLSSILAVHPRLIQPIFEDPDTLLVDRVDLETSFREIRSQLEHEGSTPPERDLDALRLFHDRETVNIGLLDLTHRITPNEASGALTEVAEVALEQALALAIREVALRDARTAGDFLVIGMGTLGSRELTYGSDLDVIFLYAPHEDHRLEAQEFHVRLTQKLLWALQTRTSQGICYDIDTRLRPSGNQGTLVTSFPSFAAYHHGRAELWERQAMLRARAVVGSPTLAERFESLRLEVLRRPVPVDTAGEIHRIRLRMEAELAQEDERRRDFKTGRGGLSDVETAVQYLQLRHGAEHADLLRVDTTDAHVARLGQIGCLAPEDAAALSRGWSFLTHLSSRLRILDNRSISDLDEERGDLEGLARRLGYESGAREGAARRRLLDDYREITDEVRLSYLRVLGLA